MEHTADWWLGDLEDSWSQALQTAVADEWGVEPLRIREGGVCHPMTVYAPHFSDLYPVNPFHPLPRERVRMSCSPFTAWTKLCGFLELLSACFG